MSTAEVTIPVGGIQLGLLPPPSGYQVVPGPLFLQSDRTVVLMTHAPDAQVQPDSIVLLYENQPASVVNALRAHYRDFCRKTWQMVHPQTGLTVVVRHAAPPSFSFQHRVSLASAQVPLEVLAVYD